MRRSLALFAAVVAPSGCFIGVPPDAGDYTLDPVPVDIELSVLTGVNGDVVETPLDVDLAHPLAAGRIAGSLVVLSAEVVERFHTGTMLVFVDPFGAASPPLRINGAWDLESSADPVRLRAVFGDVDDDGDDDVIVHCGHPAVIALLDDGGTLRVLGPVRTDLAVHSDNGALADIDSDGDVEVIFADDGFDREGAIYDVVGGALQAAAADVTHLGLGGVDHCISDWFNVHGGLWSFAGACGTDDNPSPPGKQVVVVENGAAADFAALGLDHHVVGVVGRGAHDVDLFVSGLNRLLDGTDRPGAFAVRRDADAFEIFAIDVAVDAVADLDADGAPEIVDVPDDVGAFIVLDLDDREQLLLVR